MRIFLFSILFFLGASTVFSQDIVGGKLDPYSRNRLITTDFPVEVEKDTIHHWKVFLKHNALFNQLIVDNWIAGGTSAYSGTFKINYETYYKKDKRRWINKLYAIYGVKNQNDDNFKHRKTDDELNFTSAYRYNLKKNWYLGASLTAKTQFSEGYSYTNTEKTKISNFLSPGYLTIGAGVDYVVKDKLELSLHPISSRVTIVQNEALRAQFNMKNNHATAVTLGTYLGGHYKAELFKNVKMDNSLGVFSDYTYKPLNLDIAYRLAIDMKINNFLNTAITFETLYDADQIEKIQLKQSLGVGVIYTYETHK